MWEEDEKILLKDSSHMIDVAFHINCKTLPYDHAYELSQEIINRLPWMKDAKLSGIQHCMDPIQVMAGLDLKMKKYFSQKGLDLF